MNKGIKQTTAAILALSLSVACVTGCSKTAKDDSSKGESSKSAGNSANTDDSKLDIYIDEDGAPYYFDTDGSKMMLFASPYESTDDDPTENYIYDHYDSNGLTFDIPEGWYADDSYGSPTLFMDGEEDNFDEYISIVPSNYVLDPDDDGSYNTEKVIKAYYDDAVSEGYYLSYEISDKGDTKLNGVDAKYYVLKVTSDTFSEEGEEETIRIKYIITGGDNSHAVIMTSLDTDESYDKVVGAFDSIADTVTLPTAEQMKEAEEAYDDEEILLDDDEDIEYDDDSTIDFNIAQ